MLRKSLYRVRTTCKQSGKQVIGVLIHETNNQVRPAKNTIFVF